MLETSLLERFSLRQIEEASAQPPLLQALRYSQAQATSSPTSFTDAP